MSDTSYKRLLQEFPGTIQTDNGFELRFREDDEPVAFRFEPSYLAAQRFASVVTLLRAAQDSQLVETSLLPRGDGEMAVSIAPGRNCGFVTIRQTDCKLFVEVKPKINGTNLFALLSLDGEPRRFLLGHQVELAAVDDASLVELLSHAYATALAALFQRAGLRGLHESKHERLYFRARGRVDVGGYLREFAAGRPYVLPCRFATHTVDNRVNRVLRWALHELIFACREAGANSRPLERLDNAFAGVGLDRGAVSALRDLARLPAAFDHYRETGTTALADMIVRGMRFGSTSGQIRTAAVAVPMYEVFEAAFARVVANSSGLRVGQISKHEWPISAAGVGQENKGGTFIPDVVLPPEGGRAGVVADTKWKSGLSRGVAPGDLGKPVLSVGGIKLYNGDLFQMLAYLEAARRIHGAEFIGVLVYPVADVAEQDLVPLQLRVGSSAEGLPLFLLPWDVGRKCFARIALTWKSINQLRTGMGHAVQREDRKVLGSRRS